MGDRSAFRSGVDSATEEADYPVGITPVAPVVRNAYFHFSRGGPIMVRLLEKLWGAPNRVAAPTHSPSQAVAARLRGLTPPAQRSRARRSCRLQVEPLEDRLTPSGLDFFPVAHVAVNPQPLPPSAIVEFDPLPTFRKAGGEQIKIAGVLSKEITIPPATAGTAGQTWSLEVFYDLTANETVTIMPPDPFSGQESLSATYSLAGAMNEVFALMATNLTQPVRNDRCGLQYVGPRDGERARSARADNLPRGGQRHHAVHGSAHRNDRDARRQHAHADANLHGHGDFRESRISHSDLHELLSLNG